MRGCIYILEVLSKIRIVCNGIWEIS